MSRMLEMEENQIMDRKNSYFFNWLVKIRRELHRHPEISMQERETTRRVAEILKEFGWDVKTFNDVTGAIGLWKGIGAGPVIALRADMDALPIQEKNLTDYVSTVSGVMHACGHDAHTAILLGVARKIAESGRFDRMRGAVKLIFQPGEETMEGARAMIAHGVLEDPPVQRIYALHVGSHIPAGQIGLYARQAYAATDSFSITFSGKGTHGARPDEGRDPITASAFFITAIQSIVSRNVKPIHPAVISVGKIHAGRAPNIIPETVTIEGTLRSLNSEVREILVRRLEEMAKGVSLAFQVSSNVQLREGTPPITNDPGAGEALRKAAERVFGRQNIIEEPPTMGGEDFAFYAEKCPAAIARLGCGIPEKEERFPLHSPHFDLDERALLFGVTYFFALVEDFFGGKQDG